jgi:hypothetical protein
MLKNNLEVFDEYVEEMGEMKKKKLLKRSP